MVGAPSFLGVTCWERPYPHALIPRLFPPHDVQAMDRWLRGGRPWRETQTHFYSQSEFDLVEDRPTEACTAFCSEYSLRVMTAWLEATFEVKLLDRCEIIAHRLRSGQGMDVHDDFLEGGETHRLAIQIGSEHEELVGGETLICETSDAASVKRIVAPIPGLTLAFPIRRDSYHAVAPVKKGLRHTLVYSFYADRS